MKTIVQTGPEAVELQEREPPKPSADEVLVRVHSAGICGSDAHAYRYEGGYEWILLPRIMGHEYSGEVVEVGANVSTFQPGDKVVEEPIHDCGACFQCRNGQPNVCQNFSITGMHRDGAYANYTVVEPRHLHAVPEDVPLGHAAITEPTSIATRAVFDRSNVTPGDTVLVEGPGPIGALIATIADSMGATAVVSGLEKDEPVRLPQLESMGIETTTASEAGLDDRREALTDGIGFDVVFDATGHHTGIEMAIEQVRKGGQIVAVGLPGQPSEVFMTPVVRGEIEVTTSYGSTWTNFEQALRLMQHGQIDVDAVVDPTYRIDRPTRAFEDFLASKVIKPVFSFNDV